MFYPDFTNGYKSRFFNYAPRTFYTLGFIFFEVLFLSITLIVSDNIGDGNNLKLGISIFLITIVFLSIFTLYVYREDFKNTFININQLFGTLIHALGIFMSLVFVLISHSFYYGESFLFMLINMGLAFSYYIVTNIIIFKFIPKIDKNDKTINNYTKVINVLTKESTEKLLSLSEKTSIRLIVSKDTKKIFIDLISIDKKHKQIFEYDFKKSEIEIDNSSQKLELTHTQVQDYKVIKFQSVDHQVFLQVSDNKEQKNLKYHWFIDTITNTNKKVDLYVTENNSEKDKAFQNSINVPNRYIFLSSDFKKVMNKYEFISIIFRNQIPIRYIIEIENFRFQDLDEDRKYSLSRLIEESFFENNEYSGSIIKTQLMHNHGLDLNKNNDQIFKSNHIFIMLEEKNTANVNPNFATKFLKRFKEIQNEFSGFNLKLNLMNKYQTIEILHNIFSNENIHQYIYDNLENYKQRDLSLMKNFSQFETMINNENDLIKNIIEFKLNKSFKDYAEIQQTNSSPEKIMLSHADTLPIEDTLGLFTRLFSRDIDETIKITYQRYEQNSGKNKVHKHLSRSNKYFKKLYPDKKMYKIKYSNEADNIRSALIRMYEGQVYQFSFDIIKKSDIVTSKEPYTYMNQGIRIKKSYHNHLEQAAFLMKPSNEVLTERKYYTFLGVYLVEGKTLSKLGMFGESIDYDEKGLYVGTNLDVSKQDNNDVPVVVDFSEYTDYSKDNTASSNGHMVIIGKSGSGKTYLTKSIIHQKYEKSKRQIIAFDIEDDYQSITKNENISKTIDIASFDNGINPFRIIYHQDELDDNSNESLKKVFSRHIYFLQNFIKDMFHITADEFDSELYGLISKIYQIFNIDIQTVTVESFRIKDNEGQFPTMETLLQAVKKRRQEITHSKVLEDHSQNYEVLNHLYVSIENQLIENLKDSFWNKKFNTDYRSNNWDEFDIIRINLKELIRSSQIIHTYKLGLKLLMQQLEIYIFNRNVPNKPYQLDAHNRLGVFITVDEAHRYFKKELLFMVDFFAAIAKQGRKRVIELCMISQNISDFYRQSDSKDIEQKASDIIKNSGYKFVMQVAQDFDRIYDFIESGYQLSDAEKGRIKSLNRYRVYLIQGPFKRTMIQTHALQSTKDYYGDDL